jgi:hypothetical protein
MFQLSNLVAVRGFRLQDSHKTHDANVPIAGTYMQALNALTVYPLAFIKTVNHLSHFSIVLGGISIKNSKKSGFGRTMDKKFSFKSNNQFINQLVWTQSAAQYASEKDTKPKKWI